MLQSVIHFNFSHSKRHNEPEDDLDHQLSSSYPPASQGLFNNTIRSLMRSIREQEIELDEEFQYQPNPTNLETFPSLPPPDYFQFTDLSPPVRSLPDDLPNYSCDLMNKGYLYLRLERGVQRSKLFFKEWSMYYFILQGTSLRIYDSNPFIRHHRQPFPRPKYQWNLGQICTVQDIFIENRFYGFKIIHKSGAEHTIRHKTRQLVYQWRSDIIAGMTLALDIDLREDSPF